MTKQISHSRENDSILCHDSKTELLGKIINSGKIPHAFLFTGPKGIGKASCAYNFAKLVLSIGKNDNVEEDTGEIDMFAPAQKSEQKQAGSISINKDVSERIKNGTHSDLFVIEMKEDSEKKNISIEEVRSIGKFLSLTPSESQYRVAIIDSIDDFNINSSNAILKILEEPTNNTILIIICHNRANLLPTIKSRCLEIKFNPLNKNEFIFVMEKNGYADEDLNALYNLSEGSPRLAIDIIDKDAISLVNRYLDIIRSKIVNIQDIMSISKDIKSKDAWEVFSTMFLKSYANEIKKNKKDKEQEINNWQKISEIIYLSSFQNMDIQDTLKNITSLTINNK